MSRILLILGLFAGFYSSCLARTDDEANLQIKNKLSSEARLLQKDITDLHKSVSKLKHEKARTETQIKNLKTWGIGEQTDKFLYYEQLGKCEQAYQKSKEELLEEQEKHKTTKEKYQHVKKLFAIIGGAALTLLYLQIGRFITFQFAGPYAFLFSFFGPVAAFVAGYGFIYLYF